jgi:hypothetical protein
LRVERLADEGLRAAGLRLVHRVLADLPAEHDHLDRVDSMPFPDALQHLPAVDLRHHHVEEDQVGRLGLEGRKPFVGASGLAHGEAVHLQVDADELPDPWIVVDDQHERSRPGPRGRGGARGAGDEGVEVTLAVAAVATRRVERGQPSLVRPLPDRALRDAEVPRGLAEGEPVRGVVPAGFAPRFAPAFCHRQESKQTFTFFAGV